MTTAAFCFRRPARGCRNYITPTHLPLRRNTYHLGAFLFRRSTVRLVQELLHPTTRTQQSATESMAHHVLSECPPTRSRSLVFLSCLPQLRLQARRWTFGASETRPVRRT